VIGKDIYRAKELLEAGQLVAIPTETVYGLAGNALREEVVLEIFRVKDRPAFDPLIIHVPSMEAMLKYITFFPPKAKLLAAAFLPGPLTLLLPKSPVIPDLVTSGLETVAIRIPAHPMTRELLSLLNFPLASPSANPFGYISPTTAQHVEKQLGKKIPYILDGGPCEVGLESTIIGFVHGDPVVYRKGGVTIEDIESVVGQLEVQTSSTSNPAAPGMLKSHYAPRTPLQLYSGHLSVKPGNNFGVISLARDHHCDHQEILSPTGDLSVAARHLFAAMRRLDAAGLDIIYAELMPEEGLGRAINDRLRRAATG